VVPGLEITDVPVEVLSEAEGVQVYDVAFPDTVSAVEPPLQMLALFTLNVTVDEPDIRLAVAVFTQPLTGFVAVNVNTPFPEATGLAIVELLNVPPAGEVHVKVAPAGFIVEES